MRRILQWFGILGAIAVVLSIWRGDRALIVLSLLCGISALLISIARNSPWVFAKRRVMYIRLRTSRFSHLADRAQRMLAIDNTIDHGLRLDADEDQGAKKGKPLLAPVRLLDRRPFWPNWSYQLALLTCPIRLSRIETPLGLGSCLEITLDRADYGIYSNEGKRLLKEVYLDSFEAEYIEVARQVEQFFRDERGGAEAIEIPLQSRRAPMPLRRASGGGIAKVRYRGRDWVLLHFRDIHPIGWNVSNGGSESYRELFDIDRLMLREMAEEIVILDGFPVRGVPRAQRLLHLPHMSGLRSNPLFNRRFTREHHRLRWRQDRLHISQPTSKELSCPLYFCPTPYKVSVKGPWSVVGPRSETTDDVLVVVNPEDLAIEVLAVAKLSLHENDYLLDGEIANITGPTLTRRPTMLLALEWLKRLFAPHGQIGIPTSGNRRVLPPIPESEFVVFDAEIQLRQAFLQRGEGISRVERAMHERWLGLYSAEFSRSALTHEHLRTLCPVTWKALELILLKGIWDNGYQPAS